MHTLHVELGERRYPIRIGASLLGDADAFADIAFGRHVLVVSDGNVEPLYAKRVLAMLPPTCEIKLHVIPAGETFKTLSSCAAMFAALANMQASRDAVVIALGGGVVGDLAGFAAACWMRGVRYVQVPTTLLAMVDSSVGGKTAVDLPQGKNLVGAFHQPCAVIIDTDTLATLPARELSAGLAEVVKYGAIGDRAFFGWIEEHADALLARDPKTLAEAVRKSCAHKAKVVAKDEIDLGPRALLNFGHTFGHALEVEAGFGKLLHGEAVAIGMMLAARLSSELGHAPLIDTARLAALLERLNLPVSIPDGLAPAALLERMRLDKKNVAGQLRLVLWRGIGRAYLAKDVDPQRVLELLGDELGSD
jgi:3-dehydroquinate synthase